MSRTAWNKGKSWSQEVKQKISDSLVGKPRLSKRKGVAPWNKGKALSEEHKERIRVKMREYRENIQRTTTDK